MKYIRVSISKDSQQPHKRIVFDIDDTISFTTSRDWENAIPNEPVIQKINKLYDQGYEIYLVTARGSISCKTRTEAYDKYFPILSQWLERHNVKYHVLSFEKELATYYVDDKALTPEQFLELDIKTIKTGWSGATIELRDGKIYKTHPNSKDSALWYDIAKNYIHVPHVHSLIGDTLCLEYIDNKDNWKVSEIKDIIDILASMPDANQHQNSFHNYMERIYHQHVINPQNEYIPNLGEVWYDIAILLHKKQSSRITPSTHDITIFKILSNNELFSSFAHGDMSIDNILFDGEKIILIDPIYEPNKETWSSWLLDVSKLLMSLNKNNKIYQYRDIRNWVYKKLSNMNLLNVSIEDKWLTEDIASLILNILELMQWIRVAKYAPKQEHALIRKKIELLYNQIIP